MREFIKQYDWLIVVLWAAVLFFPFLGAVHLFDWDEINFAESAREMLVSGNYQQVQINFVPFMEKPPLFFWLQALSMKLFGVNEYAARFPNALTGLVTLLLVFQLGKRYFGRTLAFFWVLMITGSLTPHLYFKSGIIDPLYNLFIFLSVYQFFLFTQQETNQTKHAWLMGMFLGLAIITKGPVAVIILVLVFLSYWAIRRFKLFFQVKHIAWVMLSALAVSAIWFGYETLRNGPTFLIEFVKYQADLFLNPVAGHGQPFYYHPLVLLIGAFPASLFALKTLFMRQGDETPAMAWVSMMQLLFWVVLILFSSVTTKIVHYSSLCYLPLTFLAAYALNNWFVKGEKPAIWQQILLVCIGLILALVLSIIPMVDALKIKFIPHIDDLFARGNLMVKANWRGYESFPPLFLGVVVVITAWQIRKGKVLNGVFMLLLFMSFFLPVLLRITVPNIEVYTQRSAIEFYEKHSEEDAYIQTIGFKSYAQYFYGKVKPHNSKASDESWLLSGAIDKPAYLVLKVDNLKDHVNPEMKELYRKGGFVFFRRDPVLPKAN
ncbi:MAG: glycosyltransferase family 39 protein [Bacteroidia bacterium]|nr:glycosyltransferase family 39 protein [Bacteroidia bacterium]